MPKFKPQTRKRLHWWQVGLFFLIAFMAFYLAEKEKWLLAVFSPTKPNLVSYDYNELESLPTPSPIAYQDCEQVSGMGFEVDYGYDKQDRCYFEQAIFRSDVSLCFKVHQLSQANCITKVAEKTQNWEVCMEIKKIDQFGFIDCVSPFALKVAKDNPEQGLRMCGEKYNACHGDIMDAYVTAKNIQNKELAYRCLKYQEGDEFMAMMCRRSITFLANHEAHRQLFEIYGYGYPTQGKKLCSLIPVFESGNTFTTEYCYKQVTATTAEMYREGSNAKNFLEKYPNGYGEPKLINTSHPTNY
jgi:hypothetical protein